MRIAGRLAHLTPQEQRISGYGTPTALAFMSTTRIEERLRAREADGAPDDHDIEHDRQVALEMIVAIGGYLIDEHLNQD